MAVLNWTLGTITDGKKRFVSMSTWFFDLQQETGPLRYREHDNTVVGGHNTMAWRITPMEIIQLQDPEVLLQWWNPLLTDPEVNDEYEEY